MFKTGKEIIEKGILTETNFIYYVGCEKLVAHDPENNFQVVDWKRLKSNFEEIQNRFKEPIKTIKKEREAYYKEVPSRWSTTTKKSFRDIEEPVLVPRVVASDNHYDKNGTLQATEREDWDILLLLLRDESLQIHLPSIQYKEILKGWGQAQSIDYAMKYVYPEENLAKLTPGNDHEMSILDHIGAIVQADKKTFEEELSRPFTRGEKGGLTQVLRKYEKQLPAAYALCFKLITEALPTNPPIEYTTAYNQQEIIKRAHQEDVSKETAIDIYRNIPKVLKRLNSKP